MRAEGLHPSDTNGLADPYIKFLSDPPSLFTAPGKKPKQTEVIMTSLSPKCVVTVCCVRCAVPPVGCCVLGAVRAVRVVTRLRVPIAACGAVQQVG